MDDFFKPKQIFVEKPIEQLIEKEKVKLVIVEVTEPVIQSEITLSDDEKVFKQFSDFHIRIQPWLDNPVLAVYRGLKKIN
jgi:hypothetical protein